MNVLLSHFLLLRMKKRIKVLFLGHFDTPLEGHVLSRFNAYPDDKYDKRVVVLDRFRAGEHYESIYDCRNAGDLRKKKFNAFIQKIRIFFNCGLPVRGIKEDRGYNFYISAYNSITAEDILAKYPDFKPELIVLMWTRTFVSAKTVRRLYELTHARILFEFVDEAHMTGGCHYPLACKEYLNGCNNCPALRWAKSLAAKTMADKIKYYAGIPKYIVGSPYDLQLASDTTLFRDARRYPVITNPSIPYRDRNVSRQEIGVKETDFVMLCIAGDVRKGLKYAVEAVNIAAKKHNNMHLIILGDVKLLSGYDFNDGIHVHTPGYVPIDELYTYLCASDCYVNSTIADSGPIMVNFSFALGVPVVSFNIGAAATLVVHEKTGYIAEYQNSQSLASGIDFIYNLPQSEWKEMSEQCKLQISQFSAQDMFYNKIYDNWETDFQE